jgi:hypothetical protein
MLEFGDEADRPSARRRLGGGEVNDFLSCRHVELSVHRGILRAELGQLLDRAELLRQYDSPEMTGAARRIVEICHKHNVVVGNPHTNASNVARLLSEGYRLLMSAPGRSYGLVGQGRELAGYCWRAWLQNWSDGRIIGC